MKQSIFFYKELTPAEVGKTGTHEIYVRLPNNFDFKTFFSNSGTQNGSVIEINFMATDTTDGGSNLVQLRFVYFMNSNQEKRIPSLGDLFRNHKIQDGDIVCLKRSGDASNPIFSIRFYRKGTIKINPSSIYFINIDDEPILHQKSISTEKRLQQIYYGAPGTGKSNTIKKVVDEQKKRSHRTTFHPDSDYSTFVGCYKPTMSKAIEKSSQPILDYDSLVDKFKEYLTVPNVNITKACTLFGYDYHDSIIRIQEHGHKVMDLVNDAYKSNTSYDSVVRGGMACYEQNPIKESNSKITYQFVPQAFTNAYVEAWNTEEEVYLIIEEINRGNCAQIFGDLFQLLDRKNGVSEYPIEADTDLQGYLNKALANTPRTDIPEEVKSGKKLMLPSNLYIWATMNTSDQSLFPIDSAFKRRWDWKFMKIRKGKDENGNELDWKIVVKDKDKNIVKINNEDSLSWWAFIEKINEIIASMTSSADKQLGYFFCKADEKANGTDKDSTIISANTFVGKVLFYLWNDVFKDYGFEDASLFRYKETIDGKETVKDLTFPDFYDEDGENVNTTRVVDFVQKVMNWKKKNEENN